MLRKFKDVPGDLAVGQTCWYWRAIARGGGGGHLRKNNCRGPATVAMRENDAQGHLQLYWLVNGTPLLRCSKEQVRPIVQSTRLEIGDDLSRAAHGLRRIVGHQRRPVQYTDLLGQPAPN